MTPSRPLLRSGLAVAVAAGLFATGLLSTGMFTASAANSPKSSRPQVWIDIATQDMAGMPQMGGLGRAAMGMFGGGAGQNHYGATRYGAMPGKYVDIAVFNPAHPGSEAQQLIPDGLQLGASLPLLPPRAEVHEPGDPQTPPMHDMKSRILIYWGCGTTVRPGQPKEIRIDVKNGQVQMSGAMQGRYVPDRSAKVNPSYVLWPNDRNHPSVPDDASLLGEHHITGAGLPESLKFTMEQAQDFMPKIALAGHGSLDAGQTWTWQSMPLARGYFLHAFGMKDDAIVLWSSSETADAGMGVLDYLPPATVDKWIKEKVLLAPTSTSCAMPAGIFAGGERSGGGMLRMIAFGPETSFAWPPKPANAKAAWNPEWTVRVRNKSTTTAMLGMDIDATDAAQGDRPKEKKPLRKLLKGILGH
ncbi:hypothetical protein [Lysobacter fragariae]